MLHGQEVLGSRLKVMEADPHDKADSGRKRLRIDDQSWVSPRQRYGERVTLRVWGRALRCLDGYIPNIIFALTVSFIESVYHWYFYITEQCWKAYHSLMIFLIVILNIYLWLHWLSCLHSCVREVICEFDLITVKLCIRLGQFS